MKSKGTAASWILQIMVALILAMAAVTKLAGMEDPVRFFESLGMEPSGRYIVAVVELTAAVLLLIPYSVPWGAILGWGVMTGALIAHATKLGVLGPMLPMTLAATFIWLACMAILYIRRYQAGFIREMIERE